MTGQRRGIPWSIAIPPEVHCEYCGVKMSDYHADPQLMMEVQLEGPRILHEKFGLPLHRSVSPDFTVYAIGSTLGLEVKFLQDHAPSPKGHPIKTHQQMAELRVPDEFVKAGLVPRMLEFYEYMKQHAPEGVTVGFGLGTQGPFTTAVLLRGNDLFLDIHDEPELVHQFLQTVTDNSIRGRELAFEITGTKPGETIGYADDYGGLLPPDQYIEFDVQYLVQIAEHFGATRRTIHTELLRRPHLKILQDYGWSYIDVGTDPYLTVKDCVEVLDIDFLVQMKTSGEILLATPDEIKQTYRQMVADGAQRMVGELCPGMSEENVRALIEVAKEFE